MSEFWFEIIIGSALALISLIYLLYALRNPEQF